MKPYPSHNLANNHLSPRGKRTSGWPTTAAAALVLTENAIGAKPGSGGGDPPPATAAYSMERIPQPGWGGDYQIENINERGDAAGVTIIKSGRYTLAGEGFFWDGTAKANRRLSPLPTSATGSVVHNATWGGGISDDGRIIYGASMRSSADGLVATPHKDLTPVVWINTGTTTLPAVNLEPQLLAFSGTNFGGWGFVSFSPDFGPTVCNRLTSSGDFLFLQGVTGTDYYVDLVARLDWTTPTPPTVTGMWVLGLRRTATEGGFNGDAYSIVEGNRALIGADGFPQNRRFVNVAGSYRSFDETGTPTPESAAVLGRMPMNWEMDVESGVVTRLTLSHLDPPVDTTTGWGIDVNALGATIGLAKAAGEEVSLAYYWTPDGSPVRPAELPN